MLNKFKMVPTNDQSFMDNNLLAPPLLIPHRDSHRVLSTIVVEMGIEPTILLQREINLYRTHSFHWPQTLGMWLMRQPSLQHRPSIVSFPSDPINHSSCHRVHRAVVLRKGTCHVDLSRSGRWHKPADRWPLDGGSIHTIL